MHVHFFSLLLDHQLALEDDEESFRVRCFYRGQHKLILCPQTREFALFDLAVDPGEQRDLWSDPDHAELGRELLEAYALEAARTEYAGRGRVSGP